MPTKLNERKSDVTFCICVRVIESLSLVNKFVTESRRILLLLSFTDLGRVARDFAMATWMFG